MNGDDERRLWKDVGYIKAGVDGLKDEVGRVHTKIDKLGDNTVKKEDCVRVDHSKQIGEITKTLASVSHKVTATTHQAVRVEPRGLLQRFKDNIGVVTVVLGLVGLLVAGGVKFAYLVVNLDQIAKKQEKAVQENKRVLTKIKAPRVIYVHVPRPDGG